jgi:hypothetical protein
MRDKKPAVKKIDLSRIALLHPAPPRCKKSADASVYQVAQRTQETDSDAKEIATSGADQQADTPGLPDCWLMASCAIPMPVAPIPTQQNQVEIRWQATLFNDINTPRWQDGVVSFHPADPELEGWSTRPPVPPPQHSRIMTTTFVLSNDSAILSAA